ncbi:AMP-binding enzyme family protein [Aspergillus niger]|uniref:AMP-binding enzyme family protein n=1 Tax=Aspergillus niger TaxID=5061 RepID=A0A505IBJ9_ASPNG|nr:AMP-binding enzyme family protein [Aspergillus niger]
MATVPQLITRQVQLQYFLGDLRSAGVTLSIATRLLYAVGAHTLPTEATLSRTPVYDKSDIRSHLRDLFWLCYSFDKDICIRTGQPPCINDTHCDLSLPGDYIRLQNINLQQDMPPVNDNTIPLYPWDLRLSMLKSRIYEDLYSAVSLYQSASQLLSSIRALDETLEQWRVSLPSDFRPTLYFSDDTHISANVNTQAVMLRLAYYHCVISIHQAANRYRNSAVEPAGTWLSGITSSINLSITASRSTLSYLKRVLPIIKGECFWIILFYAITAVLTLFCDTISDPHGPDVHHNVELLQDVPGLIHRVPVRHLALGELTHLQYLNGFTTELAAICARATSKARRG